MSMDKLRARIDELDRQLVELLNERANCAVEIGHLKRQIGMAIYQPEREAEVIRNVRERSAQSGGPLSPDAIARLFERIIDEGRRLERVVTGDAGSTEAGKKASAADGDSRERS